MVSFNRIVTKLVIENDRVSTVLFFLLSCFYIAFSYVLHSVTSHSPFVRYHMKACTKIVLRPDEDRGLTEPLDNESNVPKYGVLTLESSPPVHVSPAPALSFSNPVYELSNPTAGESSFDDLNNMPETPPATQEIPNVAFKVEHVLNPLTCTPGRFGNFKSGLESRYRVANAIYPYMVSIALAYCVTLSLYPGIESEIISCNLGTWMPVLLMFTFNTADVIGKLLASVPYAWSRRQLILMSGLRVILIPLLLLCCAPRSQPVIAGEAAAFVFSAALGVTNGLAGSLPMMLAPAKVPATLKEVTGNMMTLSYNVGLTAGSLIGYVFDSMLGPQLTNPCPVYPYIPSQSVNISTTTPLTTLMTQYTTLSTSTSTFPTTILNNFSFYSTSTETPFRNLTTTAISTVINATTEYFKT